MNYMINQRKTGLKENVGKKYKGSGKRNSVERKKRVSVGN